MNRMFLFVAIAGLCFLTLHCPLRAQEKENAPPDRAAALLRKAGQFVESGEILEAEAVYVEAAKVLEQQMGIKNTDAIILSWCRCRIELGETQFSALKLPEAKASFTTAMAYLQQVIPLRPKDPAFRFEFAKMHRSLGKGYLSVQRCSEAEIHQREAVELLQNSSWNIPTGPTIGWNYRNGMFSTAICWSSWDAIRKRKQTTENRCASWRNSSPTRPKSQSTPVSSR
jgi:tetratricopeptide (TPR) repeat protein